MKTTLPTIGLTDGRAKNFPESELVRRRCYLIPIVPLLLTVAGCGSDNGQAQFVYSPVTLELSDIAQEGVGDLPGAKEMLDERFGTPQHLRAWLQLPVEFGGTTGEVQETPAADVAIKSLKLSFEEPPAAFTADDPPMELQFVNGNSAGASAQVIAWNPDTGVAELQTALESAPAAGDGIMVGAGENLQKARGLYMEHCAHCHGTSGDGNGPTAEYMTPKPRDYRNGIFKFTTTGPLEKVSRDDLHRTLRNGIPGTYMPSFIMLSDEERSLLVEYVRWLAMRGEFERKLAAELASSFSKEAYAAARERKESPAEIRENLQDFLTQDLPESLEFIGEDLRDQWTRANEEDALVQPSIPKVPDSAESRRRGRELYLSAKLKCSDCHGIGALGNGPQTEIYEKIPSTNDLYPEPGLHDEWNNVNQPRNLTRGIYRGGRRPIDLYSRIYSGIKGTRMPSFKGSVSDEDAWHIVNYVLSIPHDGADTGVDPGAAPKPAPGEATPDPNSETGAAASAE